MVEPWSVETEDSPWDFPRRRSEFGRPVSSPSASSGWSMEQSFMRKLFLSNGNGKNPHDDAVGDSWMGPETMGEKKRTKIKDRVERIKWKKSIPMTSSPRVDARSSVAGPKKFVGSKGKQHTKDATETDDLPLLDGSCSGCRGAKGIQQRPRSSLHGHEKYVPRPYSTPLWREVDPMFHTFDLDAEDSEEIHESSFPIPQPSPFSSKWQRKPSTPPAMHTSSKESFAKTIVMSTPFPTLKKGSKKKHPSPPRKPGKQKMKKRIKHVRSRSGSALKPKNVPIASEFPGSDIFEMEQIVLSIGIVRMDEPPTRSLVTSQSESGEHDRSVRLMDGTRRHHSSINEDMSPSISDSEMRKRPKSVGLIGDPDHSTEHWLSKTPAYRRLVEKATIGKGTSCSPPPSLVSKQYSLSYLPNALMPSPHESSSHLTFFAIQGKSIP
jgi:hypothetical protein